MKEGSFEKVSCGDRALLLPIFVLIPAIPRFSYIVLSSEKRSAHNSWPGVKRHFVFFTLRSSPLSEGRILQKSLMMNDVTREIHEVRVKKKLFTHTRSTEELWWTQSLWNVRTSIKTELACGVLFLVEGRKLAKTRRKTLRARTRTNNKLSQTQSSVLDWLLLCARLHENWATFNQRDCTDFFRQPCLSH